MNVLRLLLLLQLHSNGKASWFIFYHFYEILDTIDNILIQTNINQILLNTIAENTINER